MDREKLLSSLQTNTETKTKTTTSEGITGTEVTPYEEQASEYSETISILSFSDTDEELQEIEKKSYVPGAEGKDEAYKDIEQVFDELENEKLLDPFTRWRPKQDPDEIFGKRSKFVPRRPLALPRTSSSSVKQSSKKPSTTSSQSPRTLDSSSVKTTVQFLPHVNFNSNSNSTSLTSVPPDTDGRETVQSQSSKNSTGEGKSSSLKINKVCESLTSPRKQLMVELIMEASQEEAEKAKKKKKAMDKMARAQKAKIISKSNQGVSNNSSKNNNNVNNNNLQQSAESSQNDLQEKKALVPVPVKVNRMPPPYSEPPRGYYQNDSDSDRPAKLTRQEELIQELAQSKDAKGKKRDKDAFSFETDGPVGYMNNGNSRKDPADRTVYKIQYKEPRWPHQVTLDKMVDRLYRVKMLILDESELKSLRDISSLLPSLIVLSVKSCGLKTLDGTLAFPNLQKLHAADNLLTHPAQCSLLTELQELDLSGNPIESFEGFGFLSVLNFLRVIKLYDTKVTEDKSFHGELRKLIPSLRDIYPKAKSHHFDFDLEDEDYLDVDYQLLGTMGEQVAEENINKNNNRKEPINHHHNTTMITKTTTPPCSAPSNISSTRQWSRRSQLQTPETIDGSLLTAEGDMGPNSCITSIDGTEESEAEPEPELEPKLEPVQTEELTAGDSNFEPELRMKNLKQIYQYVNANANVSGDSFNPGDAPASPANNNNNNLRLAGKSDGDCLHIELPDDFEFDVESMDCNSSHWSLIDEDDHNCLSSGGEKIARNPTEYTDQ